MRHFAALFGLAALGAVSPVATAPADGARAPAWRWDGPVTYDFRQVLRPETLLNLQTASGDVVRVGAFGVRARVTCTPAPTRGKHAPRSRRIDCVVDDAQYGAVPAPENSGEVAPVLEAYASLFRAARIGFTQRSDGVISDQKITYTTEALVAHAEALEGPWLTLDANGFLGCLDVHLPRAKASSWIQKEGVAALPSSITHSAVWDAGLLHGAFELREPSPQVSFFGRYDFSPAEGRLMRSSVSRADKVATSRLPALRIDGDIVVHLGEAAPYGPSREVGAFASDVGPGSPELE